MRKVLALALVLWAAGCSEADVALFVIAPPDADPFSGPDAATVAVFTLEGTAPELETVGAGGAFDYTLRPSPADINTRLIVQALRADMSVVASGATPPVQWQTIGGHTVAVLMQAPGSLVPAPFSFQNPRGGLRLQPLDPANLFAINVSPGGMTVAPDGYSVLAHEPLATLPELVPTWCDSNCMIVPVSKGWLLTRGQGPGFDCTINPPFNAPSSLIYYYTGGTNSLGSTPQSGDQGLMTRCDYDASTVMTDVVNGGGWLLGGHHRGATGSGGAAGQATADVDYVDVNLVWSYPPNRPQSLAFPRDQPQVIVLTPQTSSVPPQWLVGGGQDLTQPESTLLETYSPGFAAGGHSESLANVGGNNFDQRTGIALVCAVSTLNGCEWALALGGRSANGHVTQDLVLDATCISRGSCAQPAMPANLLAHPRWGATAAFAEGGTIVVAGGFDENGPVSDIEVLDVSMLQSLDFVGQARVIGSVPCDPSPANGAQPDLNPATNPGVMALTNGTVVIAGGTDAITGQGCSEIYFYRR